jgi:peptidoglycan L-alanyl-D-glutamate endopeptidase CwlK
MASRKIEDLVPELQEKAFKVIEECKKQGVDLLIYCTFRSFEEQAFLYKKTRSEEEVRIRYPYLKSLNLDFIIEILEKVKVPFVTIASRHVTYALPGQSWHNYGKAFDAVPIYNGKPLWRTNNVEWQIYGKIATKNSLEWGGNWKRFCEYPHVQLPAKYNPYRILPKEVILEYARK